MALPILGSGSQRGVAGAVDTDYFSGTAAELEALVIRAE